MKRFKKLLAFVISCTMILGTMSMMSFADPAVPSDNMNDPVSFDASIEITGLEAGDKVNFYKVLEWDGSDKPAEGTAYGGWKFASPFNGAGLGFNSDAEAIEEIIGDPTGNPVIEYGLTSKIAGKLAKQAGTPVNPEPIEVAEGSDSASVNIDEAAIGMYMALITPKDASMVYSPVFVSADFNTENPSASWTVTSDATYATKNGAQAAAKKSPTKTNKNAEGDTGSYDLTWTSTRPGETVKFTVDFTIPGYGEVYDKPYFKATDKLTDMTLVGTPEITDPADLPTTAYKIDGGDGDAEFTVTFDEGYLKTISVPTKVYVTYYAMVDTDAPLNVNTETNEIWTEFSHDPTDETDYAVTRDATNHYTYTINADLLGGYGSETRISGTEIIKVGVDAHGHPITSEKTTSQVTEDEGWEGPLAGATFKLYTNADCTTEYTDAEGNKLPEIKSGKDGRFTIAGLDAGVYYLLEDKAPSGYIKSTDKVKIEIKPYFTTETVTEYFDGTEWSYEEKTGANAATYDIEVLDHYEVLFNDVVGTTHHYYNPGHKEIKESTTGTKELPSSIANTKGVELPSTGGMGTTIFYVIGAVLVLGAGILLVTRRRMNIQ